MQYMLMQENKMDDMDCSLEENPQNMSMVNGSFVPKTELDYLLLGCLLESQQITPTQSSPNTLRAFSMYQRQFENHKKKFAQTGFRSNTTNGNTNQFNTPYPPQNNNNSSFIQPMYNNNNSNGSTNMQKIYQQNLNTNNSQNLNTSSSNTKFQTRPNLQQQIQNVSPNTTVDLISTSEKSNKKEKKKPKRPNKVKPQGCEWCKVTSSPVWRGGPSGKGSLCNACGLQYMKGFTLERAKETLRKSRGEWKVNSQL